MARSQTSVYPSRKLILCKVFLLACFAYIFLYQENQISTDKFTSYGTTDLFHKPESSGPQTPNEPSNPNEPHPTLPDNTPKQPNKPDTPSKPNQPGKPQWTDEPGSYIPGNEEPTMLGPGQKTTAFQKEKEIERVGINIFLSNGGVSPNKNRRPLLLCRLGLNRRCYSKYLADSVDLMYAVCPIYEVVQSEAPRLYRHHFNFVPYMKSFGLSTVVVEAIYAGQNYMATKAGNEPWEIQLTVNDTFYYRENFLNVAARKMKGYEYILWIDAHQIFLNKYWWEEALYKMEHFGSVQLFQNLVHMSEWNVTSPWLDLAGVQYAYKTTRDIRYWIDAAKGMWNGNGVGMRREMYEAIDHIIDECILGACDCAFNYANMVDYWDRMDIYPNYGVQLMPWIEETRKVLGGKADVVRGTMWHMDHEHHFGWDEYYKKVRDKFYNLTEDLYRDENFTLRIKDDAPFLEVFPKKTG